MTELEYWKKNEKHGHNVAQETTAKENVAVTLHYMTSSGGSKCLMGKR